MFTMDMEAKIEARYPGLVTALYLECHRCGDIASDCTQTGDFCRQCADLKENLGA